MYIHIYMYIYAYVCTYIHIHMHIRTYIHTYIHACIYVHIYIIPDAPMKQKLVDPQTPRRPTGDRQGSPKNPGMRQGPSGDPPESPPGSPGDPQGFSRATKHPHPPRFV